MEVQLRFKKNHRVIRKAKFRNRGTHVIPREGKIEIYEEFGNHVYIWEDFDTAKHYIVINFS